MRFVYLMPGVAMVFTVVSSTTGAQFIDQLFQLAINQHGEICPAVTAVEPLSPVVRGDALFAVACSDGGQHVLRLRDGSSASYVSTCSHLLAITGMKCF
jgi:hypothetical protein